MYNRLIDMEWDTPVGEAESCGGIAMFRISAFDEAGRFDPTVAAGEEPELCMRLRSRGWTIQRLDHDMALHDAAITRLSQWMRRSVRTGRGSLDLVTRFGDNGSGFGKIVSRTRLWAIAWPALVAVSTVSAGALAGFARGPRWGLLGAAIVLLITLLPGALQVARGWRYGVKRGLSQRDAMGYGLLGLLSKFAEMVGQLGYLGDQKRGRTTRLIEYKNAPAATSGPAVEAKQL